MKQSSTAKAGRRRVSKPAASPLSGPAAECTGDPISHEDIERLAHSYWEARGRTGGSPEEDWARAERELKAQRAAAAPRVPASLTRKKRTSRALC